MSDTSIAGLAMRLIGSLALVVGLLFLLARFANKRFKSSTGAAVQVIARQSLTRSSGIAVLTVGTRVLVVGTTDQTVTLLAELDPDELLVEDELDELAADHEPRAVVRKARPTPTTSGPLAGSILSLATWKQTMAAFTGTPSPPPPEEREAS
jgi:flagellar protein FliO/FliZ